MMNEMKQARFLSERRGPKQGRQSWTCLDISRKTTRDFVSATLLHHPNIHPQGFPILATHKNHFLNFYLCSQSFIMSGEVQVPLPLPATLAPTSSSVTSLSSSSTTRKSSTHLTSKKPMPSEPEPVADITLELKVDQISSTMGARLVVAFAELAMFLKGQVPL